MSHEIVQSLLRIEWEESKVSDTITIGFQWSQFPECNYESTQ